MRKWINLIEEGVVANDTDNETLVIDVPMLEARGLKKLLDRCVNEAFGNLAYREDKIPLRRRYVIRGDTRVIGMIRKYLDDRGINARLTESWFTTIKYGNDTSDIFKNPTRTELMKMIAADPYGSVRAWVTATDLFIFDANLLSHGDVERDLPVDRASGDGRIFIDRQGPYINENDPMGEVFNGIPPGYDEDDEYMLQDIEQLKRTLELCQQNATLNRLFPGVPVGCR